jgi:hypothetical protein
MSTPSRNLEPPLPKLAPIPFSGAVLRDADIHRDAFLHANPFKHVVIDDFLEAAFAERLPMKGVGKVSRFWEKPARRIASHRGYPSFPPVLLER